MLLPINLLTHFLLENESWLLSCITFIPTPAIPIPLKIASIKRIHCGKETVRITIKGIKKIENIKVALVYNFQFPVLLILFSLTVYFSIFRTLIMQIQ